MKTRKNIATKHSRRKHINELKRKAKKKKLYKIILKNHNLSLNVIDIKDRYLTETLNFLKNSEKTKLLEPAFNNNDELSKEKIFIIPKIFSLVDNQKETYTFIISIINSIYHNKVYRLVLDYKNVKTIHIGAQLFFDILLKEIFIYSKKLSIQHPHLSHLGNVRTINTQNENISKLLNSIGSFAIHRNQTKKFKDIIPYPLCEFKASKTGDFLFNIEKKEKDVTKMVDYVIDCLNRMNKELTPDSIEDLSIIIGEILINAEEHSTFNRRYSIGYFQEYNQNKDKFGIFNLAILNFGGTIYDKFKDPNCQRPDIVLQMKELSDRYTEKKFFSSDIQEETLWTLYALQEEVTSVSKLKNEKRGNGSIKFIESFFNLKGNQEVDNISRLAILSGNTSIVFDGSYKISTKTKNDEAFKIMTFNKEGDISVKPDSKHVKFVPNHFPGTIITAQILINLDDVK